MFKKIQKYAGEALELPPDVLDNGPKVTLMGRGEASVEYFLSVEQFSDQEVILLTADGKMRVQGQGFVLTTILDKEINIKGRISGILFEGD